LFSEALFGYGGQAKLLFLLVYGNPAGVANNFKRLAHIRFGHSDKHAVAHSDKCPPSVRTARRFFAPASTCFIVRLA
jgi:hypothetical protein